jgi:hypothetical protein
MHASRSVYINIILHVAASSYTDMHIRKQYRHFNDSSNTKASSRKKKDIHSSDTIDCPIELVYYSLCCCIMLLPAHIAVVLSYVA